MSEEMNRNDGTPEMEELDLSEQRRIRREKLQKYGF